MPYLARPHRGQPTRLPHPWDSPGKNTGVGCHLLLQYMKVKSESEVAQLCRLFGTSWTAAHQAPPSMGFSRQEYWSGMPLPSPQLCVYIYIYIYTYIYIYIYVYIYFFRFFSGYYKILNLVSCAIQLVPVVYLFYIW